MRREERRALRLLEREREREASIDPLVEGRARARDCEACGLCGGIPPCGWRQGLLLDHHMPPNLGLFLGAVQLPSGDPVTRMTEMWAGARTSDEAAKVVRTLALRGPVIVTTPEGAVVSVLGPDQPTIAFVVEQLRGIDTVSATVPEPEEDSENSES